MLLCKIEVNKVSGLNTTALVKVSQDMERKPFFVPAVKLAVFIKILPKTMPECQYNWHLIDKRECLYTCIQHFWILTVPQNMGLQEKKKQNRLQPMLRELMPISTSEVRYPEHGIVLSRRNWNQATSHFQKFYSWNWGSSSCWKHP